jgi:hypothetical protein
MGEHAFQAVQRPTAIQACPNQAMFLLFTVIGAETSTLDRGSNYGV